MSRPKVVVHLDSVDVTLLVKSVSVATPEGDGGGTATIKFAQAFPSGSFPSLTSTSHLVVKMGYEGRANAKVVFDSSRISSNQFTLEGSAEAGSLDTLTSTWRTKINDKKTLAPSVLREVYLSNKQGLHGLMRFVAQKLGYAAVLTNIPNVTLPRETIFTPQDGYWKRLSEFLDPMKPIIMPDDAANLIYIYWLDAAIPGTPATLPLRKFKNAAIPKETREIINQAIIRYWPQGRDGQGIDFGCGHISDVHDDETNRLIGTSQQLCGAPVDLSERDPSVLESIRTTRIEETGEEGERISTVTSYFVFSDGREVKFRLEQTTYATPPEGGATEKVAYTKTNYTFLPGTNYEVPAGEKTIAQGMVDLPGVGRFYREDLKTSVTQYVYGQFSNEPGVWKLLYSEVIDRGLVLEPDNVPLELATRNSAVDTSASTYQNVKTNAKIRRRVECISQITSAYIGYQWVEVDYTHIPPTITSGESRTGVGKQPGVDDQSTPIEELIQDPTGLAEGPREAPVVDGTWIGSDTESIDGAGPDTLTGRQFCLDMVAAMFRRSGKRIAQYTFDAPKLLTRLHRGSVIRGTRRAGANPHNYVITGITFAADRVKTGGFAVNTTIIARRLESGETE